MTNKTLEEMVAAQIGTALKRAINEELTGYGSALRKITERVIEQRSGELQELMDGAIVAAINDETMRSEIAIAIRAKAAKTLVNKMGGEVEKRVNELRANPVTRAKITIALEKMIEEIGHEKND